MSGVFWYRLVNSFVGNAENSAWSGAKRVQSFWPHALRQQKQTNSKPNSSFVSAETTPHATTVSSPFAHSGAPLRVGHLTFCKRERCVDSSCAQQVWVSHSVIVSHICKAPLIASTKRRCAFLAKDERKATSSHQTNAPKNSKQRCGSGQGLRSKQVCDTHKNQHTPQWCVKRTTPSSYRSCMQGRRRYATHTHTP